MRFEARSPGYDQITLRWLSGQSGVSVHDVLPFRAARESAQRIQSGRQSVLVHVLLLGVFLRRCRLPAVCNCGKRAQATDRQRLANCVRTSPHAHAKSSLALLLLRIACCPLLRVALVIVPGATTVDEPAVAAACVGFLVPLVDAS